MKELEHNFVLFGVIDDFVVSAFSSIKDLPNVRIMPPTLDTNNKLLNFLYRAHFSKFLKFIPFKGIWNRMLFHNIFLNKKPICFIFYGRYSRFPDSFTDYLKRKHKNCKIVVYHDDVAESNFSLLDKKKKDNVDLFISYDKECAIKSKMLYYPTVYSKLDIDINDYKTLDSDVYFLGRGKDRLDYIERLFLKLTSLGLKCDFNVLDVPQNRQHINGIHYLQEKMSYTDNIKHVLRTKCIVDIIQEKSFGFTYRLWEAITYDKHLLSNNAEIISSKYYDSAFIHIIDDAITIPNSFCDNISKTIINNKKELISAFNFLEFIDSNLNIPKSF